MPWSEKDDDLRAPDSVTGEVGKIKNTGIFQS